jgi:hypothetical protein
MVKKKKKKKEREKKKKNPHQTQEINDRKQFIYKGVENQAHLHFIFRLLNLSLLENRL